MVRAISLLKKTSQVLEKSTGSDIGNVRPLLTDVTGEGPHDGELTAASAEGKRSAQPQVQTGHNSHKATHGLHSNSVMLWYSYLCMF